MATKIYATSESLNLCITETPRTLDCDPILLAIDKVVRDDVKVGASDLTIARDVFGQATKNGPVQSEKVVQLLTGITAPMGKAIQARMAESLAENKSPSLVLSEKADAAISSIKAGKLKEGLEMVPAYDVANHLDHRHAVLLGREINIAMAAGKVPQDLLEEAHQLSAMAEFISEYE